MTEQSKTNSLTRRDFIKVAAVGAVAGAVVGAGTAYLFPGPQGEKGEPGEHIISPVSTALSKGVIEVNKSICSGCRTCEYVCSLVNEGVTNPELARIHVVKDPLASQASVDGFPYSPAPCLQCVEPWCLYACEAYGVQCITVDATTGAREIDVTKCDGCRKCLEQCAAYYDQPRIIYNSEDNVCVKCNLCDGDPECVKQCPMGAITYYTNTEGVKSGIGSE